MLLIDALAPTGGAERIAVEIAMRIDPRRYERVLCVSRWGPAWESSPAVAKLADDVRAAGVELLLLRRSSTAAVWAWWPLWRLLRSRRVDVLHAHKFGSNVWGTLIGRLARVPAVIAHEHMWSFQGQALRRHLDRHLIARGSDAFIAVSAESRRSMIELEGIPPEDVTYVPNGIPAVPDGNRAKLREELGAGPEDPLVGAVAVLREEKRIDVLVRAAAILKPRFPGLRVAVAGEGPLRPELEALIAELGVEDVVRLLGARFDVPDVIAALDVTVLCSNFEGGPLAIMEYMRAAKPVVATRVGGIPELVHDGENGLLVERGDHEALAERIGELLADRERAREMGERGRELQRREHDIDGMVRRLEGIYDEALARRNGRPRGIAALRPGSGHRAGGEPRARARSGGLRAEPLGSLDEARAEWTEAAERCPNLFSTWEWAAAWWPVYGGGRPLHLTALRRGGRTVAVLPLYRSMKRPLRMLRFVGHGPADQLGPVCHPDDREEVAAALRGVLRDARADLLLAERTLASEGWAGLLGGNVVRREESPVLRFSGTWEELLAARSKNFRDQARRRERKLAKAHEIAFRLSDAEHLDADLTTLFRLHAARWAEEGANAFAGPREPFHRDFAARALARGWLRLWMLEADGAPVAAWYGFRFAGAEWYYQSGRDPAWEQQSVGFVLMAHTIRETLDDGLAEYKLLRGGEQYKSRFATGDDELETVAAGRGPLGRGALAAGANLERLPPRLRTVVSRGLGA